MENKHKHLEFIQLTITRMGANSFFLKGWSITLVSAVFVLSAETEGRPYTFLALIPTVIFWGLDAYYLWQERRFRILYDHVRLLDDSEIDYSMNDECVNEKDRGWLDTFLSPTVLLFYLVLCVSITTVYLLEV